MAQCCRAATLPLNGRRPSPDTSCPRYSTAWRNRKHFLDLSFRFARRNLRGCCLLMELAGISHLGHGACALLFACVTSTDFKGADHLRYLSFWLAEGGVVPPHFLSNFEPCHLQSSLDLTSLLHCCTCKEILPHKFMYGSHSLSVPLHTVNHREEVA